MLSVRHHRAANWWKRFRLVFIIMWRFITPRVLLMTLLAKVITDEHNMGSNKYDKSPKNYIAVVVGSVARPYIMYTVFLVVTVVFILLGAIPALIREMPPGTTFRQRIKNGLSPSRLWKPSTERCGRFDPAEMEVQMRSFVNRLNTLVQYGARVPRRRYVTAASVI